jgi:hypothetical protein
MAAPADKTIHDLSGQWQLVQPSSPPPPSVPRPANPRLQNKTLSGDTEALLTLQGISWFTRKAIAIATITLTITQTPGPPATINIVQVATGGLGTSEERVLNWEPRAHSDKIFGAVHGKSRFATVADLAPGEGLEQKDFLTHGWEEGADEWIQSVAISDDAGWTAIQLWGFEVVDGVRYHSRHVVVRKGEEVKTAAMIYNYLP